MSVISNCSGQAVCVECRFIEHVTSCRYVTIQVFSFLDSSPPAAARTVFSAVGMAAAGCHAHRRKNSSELPQAVRCPE